MLQVLFFLFIDINNRFMVFVYLISEFNCRYFGYENYVLSVYWYVSYKGDEFIDISK